MGKGRAVAALALVLVASVLLAGCTGSGSCEDQKDGDSRDGCYLDRAIASKAPDLCSRITSDTLRHECQERARP